MYTAGAMNILDREWQSAVSTRLSERQAGGVYRPVRPDVQVGDLIGIDAAPNTHGCTDYAVLKYLGYGIAGVVQAHTCTSCWQVGHGLLDPGEIRRGIPGIRAEKLFPRVFARVGYMWDISEREIVPAGGGWASGVGWVLE